MNLWPVLIVFVLFFLGVPVAFAMIIASFIYFTFMCEGVTLFSMVSALLDQSSSFTMMAVPFFIMAGSVMGYGGVSTSLMDFCDMLTGRMRGGLGATNTLLSTFMGGMSGSSCADAAFEARMLVPEMTKRGFSLGYSAAITAATSCITPIIPPGIAMVIYATAASCSVGDMFLGGYVPGILICVVLLIMNYVISRRRGYEPTRNTKVTRGEIVHQIMNSIWALLLPIFIIIGLRMGYFTATECAAVIVVYSGIIGVLVYKRLKREHVKKILVESVHSTASVLLILSAASLFSRYMLWENIPQRVAEGLAAVATTPTVFMLIVVLIMFVMGMFLDTAAALVILPPLLIPVANSLGISPIHLGITMVLMDTLGGITPPFGVMMFTVMGVTKVKMSDYFKEGWPLILAVLIVCVLIAVWPIEMVVVNFFS
ncbi:MAG: TRAP transporter large permease [Lachnospiraceae bacterium]|nr:TRAP transporter large permease [Lachnospiraceae bacterium]